LIEPQPRRKPLGVFSNLGALASLRSILLPQPKHAGRENSARAEEKRHFHRM
jgi:hypothetical protein